MGIERWSNEAPKGHGTENWQSFRQVFFTSNIWWRIDTPGNARFLQSGEVRRRPAFIGKKTYSGAKRQRQTSARVPRASSTFRVLPQFVRTLRRNYWTQKKPRRAESEYAGHAFMARNASYRYLNIYYLHCHEYLPGAARSIQSWQCQGKKQAKKSRIDETESIHFIDLHGMRKSILSSWICFIQCVRETAIKFVYHGWYEKNFVIGLTIIYFSLQWMNGNMSEWNC